MMANTHTQCEIVDFIHNMPSLYPNVTNIILKYMYPKIRYLSVRAGQNGRQMRCNYYFDGNPYIGLQMITYDDENTVEIMLSDISSCCESYSISIDGKDICEMGIKDVIKLERKMKMSYLLDVKWNPSRERQCSSVLKGNDGAVACIDVFTSNHTYQINAWCDQDGYYPHTLWTKWNNHEEEEDL